MVFTFLGVKIQAMPHTQARSRQTERSETNEQPAEEK